MGLESAYLRFLSRDTQDRELARDPFLALFHAESHDVVSDDRFISEVIDWVREQIGRPETARFARIEVRDGHDGVRRAAGLVQFSNDRSEVSESGFIAERTSDGIRCDLTEFDPVTTPKDLKPLIDLLAEERQAWRDSMEERQSGFWKVFWISLVATLIAILLLSITLGR